MEGNKANQEMPAVSGDCSVCIEPYTSSVRKPIKCPFCPQTACLTCVKKYLLSTPEDAHCMGCRRAWNRDFIDSYLSIAFRKGPLKLHREAVLLDREKARQPLLQPRIQARVQSRMLLTSIMEENRKTAELQKQLDIIRDKVTRLYRHKGRLEQIADGTLAPELENEEGEKKERSQFTMKCPAEDCRGFLSSQWKCGTCQIWVCHECLVPKGKDKDSPHTCNEDMKLTAALIRKETKPCPKCGMGISKVDGCDQMWCVSCKTPFSWTTGRLVFGVVHNPHYYQWLRDENGGQAPRVAGDVPCGGIIGFYNISRCIPKNTRREVEAIHRVTSELFDERLRMLPRLDEVPDNGDLGVSYALKELTEPAWKAELWKRETKREKGLDLRGPLDLFANVSSEILRQMFDAKWLVEKNRGDFDGLMNQLKTLRGYVNSELEKIGERYGCMVPKIMNSWVYDMYGGNRKDVKYANPNWRDREIVFDDAFHSRILSVGKKAEFEALVADGYFFTIDAEMNSSPRVCLSSLQYNNMTSLMRDVILWASNESKIPGPALLIYLQKYHPSVILAHAPSPPSPPSPPSTAPVNA